MPTLAEFYSLADESRKDFLDKEVGVLGIMFEQEAYSLRIVLSNTS